jgi:phytoene dehydrogenase-like protein
MSQQDGSEESRATGHFDVVVVGAGVGGLCSAALLAHRGKRVLVVEEEDRVGGRASTKEIDGFRIGVGAVAIERGGPMEQVFQTVGAVFDVRTPNPAVVMRINGRDIDTTSRLGQLLYDAVVRRVLGVAAGRAAKKRAATGSDVSFKDWLSRFTSNATVHRVCRNITAGFYSCNSDEVPSHVLLHYLAKKSAFRSVGFNPEGTIGPLRQLAATIERDGGEVWLDARAERFVVDDGRVAAVEVVHEGVLTEVTCDQVICNAGPDVAVALCGDEVLPPDYVELINDRMVRLPMFAVNFASREKLIGDAGILFLTDTHRAAAVSCLTSSCPEMAPPGWQLYVCSAVPVPALSDYDEEVERALVLAELAEQLDGFDRARLISAPLEWPVMVLAGQELDPATPIANLWNVGDAVRAFADIGMQGSAASGIEVADLVAAAGDVGAARRSLDPGSQPWTATGVR